MFTSESVTEGHPDKICDAISDSVLDALLAQDPKSRVAVETLVTTGQVHVVGEVTTNAKEAFADIPLIVRDRIRQIGYDHSDKGFDYATCGVNIGIGAQSPDIAAGVDTAHEARVEGAGDPLDAQGAGDQGLMFGYAINDTPELMPLPIALAHRLARKLTKVRKEGVVDYLRPDGKTQVTIEYRDNTPVRLDTVVLSTQHAEGVDLDRTLAPDIRRHVVETVLGELAHETMDTSDFRLLVNPTGNFVVGGPMGDAGLTGRKIIVDTYGGWARQVGLFVETFGTEHFDVARIEKAITTVFDLRPGAIIRDLDLLRPIYAPTAAYGHFGRTDIELPWEQLDKVDELKASV
nr:methionine adenosyltransferase [Mycolicibacterium sp. CBMA 361]